MDVVSAATQSLTVTKSGVGFDPKKYKFTGSQIARVHCRVETAQIRVQTVPQVKITAKGNEGSKIKSIGEEFYITGLVDISNFKAIPTGDKAGRLQCTFERQA